MADQPEDLRCWCGVMVTAHKSFDAYVHGREAGYRLGHRDAAIGIKAAPESDEWWEGWFCETCAASAVAAQRGGGFFEKREDHEFNHLLVRATYRRPPP